MSDKININLADAATLATLPGIGPAIAQRIIEYRETVHPFEEVIELAAVPGISEKMVRTFEAGVTVEPDIGATAVPLQLGEPEDLPLLEAPHSVDRPPEADAEEVVVIMPAPSLVDELEDEIDELEEPEERVIETAVPEPEIAPSRRETVPSAEPVAAAQTPAASAQPPADWEARSRRRGCLNTLLGATFGAILGAVLTLAVLAAINRGSLSYATQNEAMQRQLETEIISRTTELNQLSTRVSLAATQEAETNESLAGEFAAANEAISEDVANNEAIISYLATRSGALELRLDEVAGAADTFTDFLDGLRGLLDDLEEGTATPTPFGETLTPTYTPTPTPFGGTQTPELEATTAVAPTRTPLPTATPFAFPTNTPAPQP